ncbi:MAG: ribosomal protein N(5)-glutamine methyltransferase [Rhizobacter sp.]|nr:ribosomal protein N(5)-glutamine methyltransferase [Rhizobacter sp.]
MTLIDLINAQSARLMKAVVSFGHGTTNAFDEAAWLVLWTLRMPLPDLERHAQNEVSPEEEAKVLAMIDTRIETRQPAAYLTKEAWLQNVPFYVDERSIVPRSFIAEVLVDGEEDGQLDAWLSQDTHKVLDLCTGNGSLACIAAMAVAEVMIDASDVSAEALEVARINVDKHKLGDVITLIQSDGLANVRGPYDLILCNPPYVNSKSMAQLPDEYQREPALALAGGEDGMDFIRPLLADVANHLTSIGVLVLEVGNERAHFERAFGKLEVAWLETSAGSSQVLVITKDALVRWSRK